MLILGINFNHPETSVTLADKDDILFSIEEERLTRIKNYSGFPIMGIKYILKKFNITLEEIDIIVTNNSKFYNLHEKIIYLIKNIFNLKEKLNVVANDKNSVNDYFKKYFNTDLQKKIKSYPHHLCHAASSYFSSDFSDCNIVSFDGFGNFSSLEIYSVKNNKFRLIHKNTFPNSLGIFYQAITQFLGFKDYGDEYKVMAMAAYGQNNFSKEMDEIVDFHDGNILLNLKFFRHQNINLFSYDDGFPVFPNLYSSKLIELLGDDRNHNEDLKQKHFDIANSLQKKFEDISLKIIDLSYSKNKSENLILTGGCAMNSLFNGKVIKNSNYKNLFVSNASGDSGGSIGCVLLERKIKKKSNNYVFNGPSYNNNEIFNEIKNNNLNFERESINYVFEEDENKINNLIINALIDGKLIGLFREKMEFGPRALGNRSLIANPKIKNIKQIINSKIKNREEFRPFACSILSGQESNYFETNQENHLELMNKVFKIKDEFINEYPGIIHKDLTCRIQAVTKNMNKRYYDLIKLFYEKSNIPMILNTSLNSSEPICCSPKDAINFFLKTKVDTLIMENYIIYR